MGSVEDHSTPRNGIIDITFTVAPGTDFATLDLNKLRFWLGNDDNYTRYQLYLWFCEYLQSAELVIGDQTIWLPEFMLKAVGFQPQDAMLPWPGNVHSGYRILQNISATLTVSYFSTPAVFRRYPSGYWRTVLPCGCVFRALYPQISGCVATPCVCIAHPPSIFSFTTPKSFRWTTGRRIIP